MDSTRKDMGKPRPANNTKITQQIHMPKHTYHKHMSQVITFDHYTEKGY